MAYSKASRKFAAKQQKCLLIQYFLMSMEKETKVYWCMQWLLRCAPLEGNLPIQYVLEKRKQLNIDTCYGYYDYVCISGGKPTSWNGVGNTLQYPPASCMLAIWKHQYIKKYITIASTQKIHLLVTRHRNVRTTVFVPSSWKDAYSRVSLHNAHHLTNLVHSAHRARAIWNTVPTACLLTIHRRIVDQSLPRLHPRTSRSSRSGYETNRGYIPLASAYFLRCAYGLVSRPGSCFGRGLGRENQPIPNIQYIAIQIVSPLIIPPTELRIRITHVKAWQQCHSVLSLCRRCESIHCMHNKTNILNLICVTQLYHTQITCRSIQQTHLHMHYSQPCFQEPGYESTYKTRTEVNTYHLACAKVLHFSAVH